MNRLGAHRTKKVHRLIEERGAKKLWFVPSYSPDLNPIEESL
jgi:transposase